MTVTNSETLDALAEISQLTYAETTSPSTVRGYTELQFSIDDERAEQGR